MREVLLEQYSNLTRILVTIERRKTALEPSISQLSKFKEMTARAREEQKKKIGEFEKLAAKETEIQNKRIEVWKALVGTGNVRDRPADSLRV